MRIPKGSRTLPRGNVCTSSTRQLEMPRCVRFIMNFKTFSVYATLEVFLLVWGAENSHRIV